ncbi:MAG: ATP-binding protein [Planctomycetota bacterium]|nr:ATP-binding protein [Planctomycetota bacterium]
MTDDNPPSPETPAARANLQGIERLLSTAPSRTGDLTSDLQSALSLAANFFGLSIGIVSQVSGDDYVIECVHQPDGLGLEVGQTFPLGNTYCAITLQADDVVSIDDMRSSAFNDHPCYEAFRLESYLGAPIRVDGELYGTLNFSSPDARPRRWTEADRDLVRLLALWVESAISRHRLNERLTKVVRRLDQSNRDLRERNEDLDFYARHASHDLQAPLKNILALMEFFEMEDGIPAQVTDDLGLIRDEVGRMLDMIKGILRFSRSSRAELELSSVNLSACCDDALSALREEIERTGARVSVGPIPEVAGDASLLTQVMQNLFENAIKYQPPGQQPEIEISGREAGGVVLVDVTDNGIGLDEEKADLVFRPLGRLHQNDQYDGSGLGLSICRKIVRRHGGELSYRSTPGSGATFTAKLPAASRDTI